MSRPPLQTPQLPAGGLWSAVTVVAETGSTNADLAAAARTGAPEGMVLAAEHQRAGRGRAGRTWSSPPRAGLAVSVLLRPGAATDRWPVVPRTRWGWLPLLAGVALAGSVTRLAGVDAVLKWPNDLLVDSRKCGGILVEVVDPAGGEGGGAAVVGIGLNVTLRTDELPPPAGEALPATSLALAGARTTDRAALLDALLGDLQRWYGAWRNRAGDAEASGLRAGYLRACATAGRQVRVLLPGGSELTGIADTVDPAGRLVVSTAAGRRVLAAGDVTHLRDPAGGRSGDCASGAEGLRWRRGLPREHPHRG